MIRSRQLAIETVAGSERKSGGSGRRAGRLQILSSFDPEGCNSPDGEQRQEARRAKPVVETATGLKRGSGPVRGEPDKGLWSRKAERAEEAAGEEAK